MGSYKILQHIVNKKKGHNHLFVEFSFSDGKKGVRFDANYLPTDFDDKGKPSNPDALHQYLDDWVVAYTRGRATVNSNNAG